MVSPRHLLLLWLSLSFELVGALNIAFPYEMVYLYNAYKAEFATQHDPALRTMARGCTHTPNRAPVGTPPGDVEAAFIQSTIDAGVVGICNFKEFMSYVATNTWNRLGIQNPGAGNPTSLDRTLNPDPDALADKVRTSGLGAANLESRNDRLIQGLLENEPWANVIRRASDIIQTARAAHAASPGASPAIFEQWISKSVRYLEVVLQFRVGDSARYMVPAMQAHVSWTSSPIQDHNVINDVNYVDSNGNHVLGPRGDTTYQVIDYKESFQKAKDEGHPLTRSQKKALLKFNQAYGTGPAPGATDAERTAALAAELHQNVIERVRSAKNIHQAPLEDPNAGCACCVIM